MANFDFETEVLKKSHEKPVLVDFWAPWCGPCRVLGPVLEQLAEEQADRWTLVKVNTEEEPELAQMFRIRGIPNVRLFSQGKEVAEFSGALPKRSIEDWLDQHLPDERRDALNALLAKLENGSHKEAIAELDKMVKANPDLIEGRLGLARALLFDDPERAGELVADVKPGTKWFAEAEPVALLADFLKGDTEDGSPAGKAVAQARQHLKEGKTDKALEALIQAVMLDKSFQEELPRKATIALFQILGEHHPLTRKYRKHFDMALY